MAIAESLGQPALQTLHTTGMWTWHYLGTLALASVPSRCPAPLETFCLLGEQPEKGCGGLHSHPHFCHRDHAVFIVSIDGDQPGSP